MLLERFRTVCSGRRRWLTAALLCTLLPAWTLKPAMAGDISGALFG